MNTLSMDGRDSQDAHARRRSPGSKVVRLHRTDMFKLYDFIKLHCSSDEHGFAHYEEGWDDNRVLREFPIQPCTLAIVQGAREDAFGRLQLRSGPPSGPLQEQVSALTHRVSLLLEKLTAMEALRSQDVDAKVALVEGRIDSLSDRIDQHRAIIHKRMDEVAKAVSTLERQCTATDTRIGTLERNVSHTVDRVGSLSSMFDNLRESMSSIDSDLESVQNWAKERPVKPFRDDVKRD